MKRIVCLAAVLTLFGIIDGFCAEGTSVKNWNTIQTYDAATLKKEIGSQVRRVVGVKFNFRGKDIHHMKPNWYEGTVWGPDASGKKGFAAVKVMVAKKDLPAFKAITTDAVSTQTLTAYGDVQRDSDANFFFVRLLGTKANPNPDGGATISW
jgi:hypothetical protein